MLSQNDRVRTLVEAIFWYDFVYAGLYSIKYDLNLVYTAFLIVGTGYIALSVYSPTRIEAFKRWLNPRSVQND